MWVTSMADLPDAVNVTRTVGELLRQLGPVVATVRTMGDGFVIERFDGWNVHTQRHFGVDCAEDVAPLIETDSGSTHVWNVLTVGRALANEETTQAEASRVAYEFAQWARALTTLDAKFAADSVYEALGVQPWFAAWHARLASSGVPEVAVRQEARLAKLLGVPR